MQTASVNKGENMRTAPMNLLLAVSVCGLWGCGSSKPLDTPSTATQPAAEPARPQPEAVSDVKPEQTPVSTSAPVHKPKENPAEPVTVNTAKAAAVPTVPAPRKENNIVQEEETVVDAESKPAD